MFCPHCGTPCEDTHKFCYSCGKPLPEIAVPAIEEHTQEVEAVIAEMDGNVQPADVTEETQETAFVSDEQPSADASQISPVIPVSKKGRLWPPIVAMCVMVCLGLTAFFLSGKAPVPGPCFNAENGVLRFDYANYTGSEELTVPGSVDGMVISAIADGCFRDCDRLTTVILPETVTIIGDNAFAGCDSLRGIYFPEGVLSVGANALAECPDLEAVSFPSSIAEIGEGCLNQCESLKYIFYDGTYRQWCELYHGQFRNGVELHTIDGVYYAQP